MKDRTEIDRTELILKYLDNPKLRDWVGKNNINYEGVVRDMIDDIRKTKPYEFNIEYHMHFGWEIIYQKEDYRWNIELQNMKDDWKYALTQSWLFACFNIDSREDK